MASIETLLISAPKEHKWVIEIDEIFKHQLENDVEPPFVSLFQVPETITSKKPEAYEPQQIGLGPIHHFRPSPYKKMEQKKLAIMRKVLKDHDVRDYKLQILDKVQKIVPLVRSCYDMILQDNDDALARIFAIDGLFLIYLFHTYKHQVDEDLLLLKKVAQRYKLQIEDVERVYEENKGIREAENREELEESDEDYNELLDEESDEEEAREEAKRRIEEAKRDIEEAKREKDLNNLLLRHNEITVTVDNQVQWESLLGVPHREPKLLIGPKERLVEIKSVAQDILMVENQIPFMVLKEIEDTLHPSSTPSILFRNFCEIHSPLKLCPMSRAPYTADHLLHYMYYSIVNNDNLHMFPMAAGLGPVAVSVIQFLSRIPKKEIVEAYEQTVSILETFSKTEIRIVPSASQLHDKSGFQFHSLEEAEGGINTRGTGIRNICLHGTDIYLPRITLNNDSEVILRNLTAYETLTANPDRFLLNEYMGLMCGLVMTKDDANYLKCRNVIVGDMGADEVAKLFTGMSSSIPTVKGKKKSRLQVEVIDRVNEVYESRPRMKAYLLLKRLAGWLLVVLRRIGSFVECSWKKAAFLVSIGTVVWLIWKAYCEVYGCGKNTVALLPYASS